MKNQWDQGVAQLDAGDGEWVQLQRAVQSLSAIYKPTTKPVVTGSRGGNAALATLLTSLAAAGVIIDNTTP